MSKKTYKYWEARIQVTEVKQEGKIGKEIGKNIRKSRS